jgi:hypothetical protein
MPPLGVVLLKGIGNLAMRCFFKKMRKEIRAATTILYISRRPARCRPAPPAIDDWFHGSRSRGPIPVAQLQWAGRRVVGGGSVDPERLVPSDWIFEPRRQPLGQPW